MEGAGCDLNLSDCVQHHITFFAMILSLLVVLIMFSETLKGFYCPKEKISAPRTYYQVTTILSFIFGIGCIVCDCIHVLDAYIRSMSLLDPHFVALRITANLLSFNSYICTDLVIFGRLYYSFYDSSYRLSSFSLCFIISLFMLIICCDITYIISLATFEKISKLSRYSLLFLLIIVLILAITMSLLFTRKIHQLLTPLDTIQQKRITTKVLESSQTDLFRPCQSELVQKQNAMDFIHEFELNKRQIKLLNVSTKNTVITGIAAFYFGLRFSYRQFAYQYGDNSNTEQTLWLIAYFSRSLIFVTNGIAVYFGFRFSDKLYHKMFGKCHKYCFKCCALGAKQHIAKGVMLRVINEMQREIQYKSTYDSI